ncbi:MAG: hypothetical protein IJS72_01810 [Oscillospiraceae bacterium]|nr:hypothetical protein [Oscillospiraceae bacterium]
MERSDRLIKFVTLIVFIALVIYAGFSLYQTRDDSLRTVPATAMELRRSVITTGYAVRDEEVLISPEGGASVSIADGERVGAGSTVAITYNTSSDLARADEIRELTIRIQALEAVSEVRSETEAARESVINLSRVIAERDYASLQTAVLDVETFALKNGEISPENVGESLEGLKLRLESLRTAAGGRGFVTARRSGTFTTSVDGYERIATSDILGRLSPQDVEGLFSARAAVSTGAFGKLIYGIRWYYVTVMDSSWASLLIGKSTVNIDFSKTYNGTVTMNVESVGQESDGKCAVVFSAARKLSETAGVREMTGEVIFESASGIRVPREAVHLDEDGDTIVYLLAGMQAQAVKVNILGEEGDYYMVEDTGAIRIGNEIITRADELRDGAIVAK